MDLHNFKQWVRRKLGEGACGVRVELDDKQIEQGLEEAKEWFNVHMGLHREETLNLVAGQSDYDLSAVTPRITDILAVWMPRDGVQVNFDMAYPGFLDVEGFPYGDVVGGIGYPQTTLVQSMQMLGSMARLLSVDKEWEFVYDRMTDPVTQKLRIMGRVASSGKAVYWYRVDPADIKLRHYRQRDLFLVREYAVAMSKYTLGRIRGKFTSGLPAAGGDRTLDGSDLIAESQRDVERLEDRILDLQGTIMPSVG